MEYFLNSLREAREEEAVEALQGSLQSFLDVTPAESTKAVDLLTEPLLHTVYPDLRMDQM
jgi:hypothetical protein